MSEYASSRGASIVSLERLAKALDYYRHHYGAATMRDMADAADPRRNYHTVAELAALEAAGIEVRYN